MSRQDRDSRVDRDPTLLPRDDVSVSSAGPSRPRNSWLVLLGFMVAALLVGTAVVILTSKNPTLGNSPSASCARDSVRAALRQAADAWANGNAPALVSLISVDGKFKYEDDGRRVALVEFRRSEVADHFASRGSSPKEQIVFNRVTPPYRSVPDGESLQAFVLRDGIDYPILITGLTDCQRGLVFREVFVAVGSR